MSTGSIINLNFRGTTPIRSVGTITELRRVLSNTIATADNMIVDGGLALGDGKGGTFAFDGACMLDDDGVATVKPIDIGDGSPGRWRIVEAQITDASSIVYGGQFASVRDALDAILYVAPTISSFAASPSVVELGSTVSSVALTWTLNKTVTSETITGLATITPDARTATAVGPFTSDRSWTLTASDGKTSVSVTTAIAFRQKRYWGVSAKTALSNADILALNGEFATSKSKTVVYDATGGNYPYIAYPAAWGDPSATVGGLAFSDFVTVTQSVTNSSGYTSDYKVVRFGRIQNGSSISVQWS